MWLYHWIDRSSQQRHRHRHNTWQYMTIRYLKLYRRAWQWCVQMFLSACRTHYSAEREARFAIWRCELWKINICFTSIWMCVYTQSMQMNRARWHWFKSVRINFEPKWITTESAMHCGVFTSFIPFSIFFVCVLDKTLSLHNIISH